uniref:Fucolectin tachylectin-4 pentraxin-1 domain-containing protein n=1 Tax=Salmo trutta TaxID=8032 RepID=A0A673VY37_SALTR
MTNHSYYYCGVTGIFLLFLRVTVQIGKYNVALRGVASQSSLWDLWCSPSKVFDGNRNSNFNSCGSCSSTEFNTNPWWRVDLLDVYRVTAVTITNRGDVPERLDGAEIRIGNSLENNGINNPRSSQICHLMQHSITLLLDVALRGVASQSSLWDLCGGSCSSTVFNTNTWWRVDLLDVYRVTAVTITSRGDVVPERLDGAEIRIGNSLENNGINNPRCVVISHIPAGETHTFQCNEMEGRYVVVLIPDRKEYLTLCEVEVYGTPRLLDVGLHGFGL